MSSERSSAPAILTRGLTKIYEPSPRWMRVLLRTQVREPVHALSDVSLEVYGGQITAIVGHNGAGKTTLFRILMGLTSATSGEARIMGMDATRSSPRVRAQIGFSPSDDRSLLLRLSCRENLEFHGRLRGFDRRQLRERVPEVLELVGLGAAADRSGFALSSGMRARLQLARAILHRPPVLILDEPTASLDPLSAHSFLDLLTTLARADDLAILISSHRLEEIEALGDNLLLLDRGVLRYAGPLEALREKIERPRIEITFANKRAHTRARRLLENAGAEVIADDLTLTAAAGVTVGRLLSLMDGQLSAVTSVRQTRIPLRDLLVAVVEDRNAREAG